MAKSSFYSGSSQDATNVNAVEDSKNAAALSEAAAAASAAAAANSAASGASSSSTASTEASNSATSATAAEVSNVAAGVAKVAAETAETNAETAQAASETAKVAAETAETNASTSAATATTQAGIATTKASEASASEIAAEAAKVAAEAALDEFTDIYLGAKASDPTTDNDGNALTAGDQYFNTTSNVLKIYNGSAWQAAAFDSSAFVEITGDTMTGDLSFGDNDKAIFGAGSDLQIYHDGSNSYIDEAGAGDLYIRGGDDIRIQVSDGLGGWNNAFRAKESGATSLFHAASTKLATTSTGVDITGTLTSDGLTVDGDAQINSTFPRIFMMESDTTDENAAVMSSGGDFKIFTVNDAKSVFTQRFNIDHATGDISFFEDTGTTPKFFWDASAERLGLGTTSPSASLHIDNGSSTHMYLRGSSGDPYGLWVSPTGSAFTLGSWGNGSRIVMSDSSEYITFGTGSATTERMRIDSSGNVGIGTSSPTRALHVNSGASNEVARFESTDTEALIELVDTTGSAQIRSRNDLRFYTNGGSTRAMDINSSGNVGIGTSSPSDELEIASSSPAIRLTDTNDSTYGAVSYNVGALFLNGDQTIRFNTDGAEAMRIDSSGNVGIGTSDPSTRLDVSSSTSTIATFRVPSGGGANNKRLEVATGGDRVIFKAYTDSDSSAADIAFNNGATSEAMRIDSSGNVGIGTSSPAYRLDLGTVSNGTTLFNVTNGSNSNLRFKVEDGVSTIMNTGGSGALAFTSGGTTERMRITSAGRVGIGKSSPDEELDIYASVPTIRLSDSDGSYSRVAHNTASMILQADEGGVGTGSMRFDVGGSETMRIDSSGNLLVGKTSASSATVGFETKPTGFTAATRDANTVLVLNRLTSDGDIAVFRKNGTTVGSIGTEVTDATLQADVYLHGRSTVGGSSANNSRLWLLGGDSGIVLDGHTNAILPTDENSYEDARTDIGSADYRFKDLYLSGDVITGGGGANATGEIQFVADSTRARIVGGYNSGGGGYLAFRTDTSGGTDLERMRIDSSGNVGIGVAPARQVHMHNASGDNNFHITNSTTGSTAADGFSIVSQSTTNDVLFNQRETANMRFFTANDEKMRIDSSGNLLVGTTTATGVDGVTLNGFGYVYGNRANAVSGYFDRGTSDGDILEFRKDGSTVGSIGSNGGTRLYVESGDVGLRFLDDQDDIRPCSNAGANRDGFIDLGDSASRFKDLYLSGGVYLGGTGAANKLDDYEEGTFTPTAYGASTAGTTTYATQTGSYTKVGDTVNVDIYISWTAMTGTGNLRIGGLPFTSSSATNYFATGTIVPLLGFTWPSGKTQLNPIMSASDTVMSIYGSATDSNSAAAATDSEIVALAITLTYKV